ncbi:MAG: zinc-binding dehydrogenase [Deltaproteobacteria bacterium]
MRPTIDSVVPLDQIADAHAKSETGRARGKIVIAVK